MPPEGGEVLVLSLPDNFHFVIPLFKIVLDDILYFFQRISIELLVPHLRVHSVWVVRPDIHVDIPVKLILIIRYEPLHKFPFLVGGVATPRYLLNCFVYRPTVIHTDEFISYSVYSYK